MDFGNNFLNDNDFSIVGDQLFSEKDIIRKTFLNVFDAPNHIKTHGMKRIIFEDYLRQKKGLPDITVPEMLNIIADVKENICLSINGRSLGIYEKIATYKMKWSEKRKLKTSKSEDQLDLE